MTKKKQNLNQQKVSDDNSSDDDFSLSELTVKNKAGEKDKVQLTQAPQKTNNSVSKAPSSKNDDTEKEKNVDVDKFRKEMDSLNKNPQANRQVIKDLQKRAQKQAPAPQKVSKADESKNDEENKKVVSKLNEAVNKKLPDNVNVSENKVKEESQANKEEESSAKKESVKKEKSQTLKENEEILFDVSKLKEEFKKSKEKDEKEDKVKEISKSEKDGKPVIADPKVSQAPKPQTENKAGLSKDDKDLVPEIDLDAEDMFAEKDKKSENQNQSEENNEVSQKKTGGLEKVSLESHSDIQRKSQRRQANVQNIRKTETIYDRKKNGKDKKQVLTASKNKKYTTVTPVEEIEILSLEEWRRFGDIAEERVAKVKEKLELLGEKGILNQIKGLNAWRRSPVMQDYLDLGIKAILSDKGLEEYMEEEKIDLDKHLDVKEWLAINRLNRELMI